MVGATERVVRGCSNPSIQVVRIYNARARRVFQLKVHGLLPGRMRLVSKPKYPMYMAPIDFVSRTVCLTLRGKIAVYAFNSLIQIPKAGVDLTKTERRKTGVRIICSPTSTRGCTKRRPSRRIAFLSIKFRAAAPTKYLSMGTTERSKLSGCSVLITGGAVPRTCRTLGSDTSMFLCPKRIGTVAKAHLYRTLARRKIDNIITKFATGRLVATLTITLMGFRRKGPFFMGYCPQIIARSKDERTRLLMSRVVRTYSYR